MTVNKPALTKTINLIAQISVTTAIFLTIYVTVQQNYRQNANDPQIQIAENFTYYLQNSQDLKSVLGQFQVDVAGSLNIFEIFYDEQGQVLATNGQLGGKTPELPSGVLEDARKSG